ncbi:family 43 glycosylhydrolase [Streptomyces oceani]|uniref:family 43 glycosylhydrolase n=1 Tax=Streptomyces oceani TaxID=1075402 RepID=UPI000ADBBE19|nr:family 43 glycosylhydrolase [Streptomyces oceani]
MTTQHTRARWATPPVRRGGVRRRGGHGTVGLVLLISLLAAAVPTAAAPAGDRSARGERPRERVAGSGPEWVGSGTFRKVYDTSAEQPARYLNDHSLIKGPDGTWHMFGITGEQAAPGEVPDSAEEDTLAHATAPELDGPWTTREPALTVDPSYGEDHLWAPHVIEHDGTYYMFYSGGGGETDAAINLATSRDLHHWTREPSGTLFRDGWVARDPFVLRVGDHWVMYYTATATREGGAHVVAYRTSTDLRNWSQRRIAFTDTTTKENSAPVTESPFVLRRGGWWYLFIGPRGGGYTGTDVYRSKDPTDFESAEYAGHFPAHAPEVVRDEGRWWVTHTGWFQGGLHLAPLNWRGTPPPWHTRRSPAVAREADGRLTAFALRPDGTGLARRTQRAPDGEWGDWAAFGDRAAVVPTSVRNGDGTLELFAVEDDGTLIHRRQSAPNGAWGPWRKLGGRAGAAPTVVRGADGRLEMFGLAPGGASLTHRARTDPDGGWGPEERFGGPAASPPAVAADAEGRLQVFVVDRGGERVLHRAQRTPGGAWGQWEKFAGPASGQPVVARHADGGLEVFLLNPYGDSLRHRRQTEPAGGWGEWSDFGGFAGGAPTVGRNADGRLEVFAVGPGNDYVSRRGQLEPSGKWGEWEHFGGPAQCAPVPASQADGRLSLLVMRPGGAGLAQRDQRAPDGSWSQWRDFSAGPVGGTACGEAS